MSADRAVASPPDALDFVVGGIPRSGTTALAVALCAHPDVYAYASETGLFRFAHDFFRRAPFPPSRFAKLKPQIDNDLDAALTLHTRDFVVQQARDLELLTERFPGVRLFPLFDLLAAEGLKFEALELFSSGRHGSDLLVALSSFLGREFRTRSGRRIVGEKTPDNIKALADLRTAMPAMKAIATVRDPFATLKSMALRAARGEQHDLEFSRHLVRNIGNYLDNLETLAAAAAAGDQLLVLRYEDLLDDGAGVMRRAFAHLGASDDEAAVALAAAILRPRPDRAAAADYFHAAERAIIARVLANAVAPFGYALDAPDHVDLSETRGATDPALLAALASNQPMLLAMHGFHGQDTGMAGAVMTQRGKALLVLPETTLDTTIDVWTAFDRRGALADHDLELRIEGRTVAACDIGSRGDRSLLTLRATQLPLAPLFNGLRFAVLDFVSSDAFRPIELTSGESSDDIREQSVLIQSVSFRDAMEIVERQQAIIDDLRQQLSGQRHLIVDAERRAAAAEQLVRDVEQRLIERIATLEAESARQIEHERSQLDRERAEAARNIEHERARADAVLSSTSWRVTAPLRKAGRAASRATRIGHRVVWRSGKIGVDLLPLPAPMKLRLKQSIASRVAPPQPGDGHSSLVAVPGGAASSRSKRPAPENAAARFKHAEQRSRRRPAHIPAPIEGTPEVSIVIPVYNQLDYTLQCLASVERYTHGITYETIVVDDCSTDRTEAALSADARIIYHRNAENLGFIGSCHAGANRARGRYIVFLNNDTEVLTNWLLELIETLEYAPDAGIAGAQLVFPNGILQEAGGIVWQDGSAWNYGRMKDPMAPEVSYLREADYVSGAALAITKDLWQRSGGFDFHYKPAYGEDSDLCFRVRSFGLKVYYQPLAKVIHYEGISSGTDTSQGVKAYQVTNARKLYERWKDDMARHRPNGEAPEFEKERGTEKRLLVIDACTPEPDKDAGSITTWEIMRSAQSLGYKVTFIPESNFTYLGRYSDDLARVGIEAIHYPFERTVTGHLEKRGGEYDAILIFRAPSIAGHLPAIKRHAPQARLILHASDLHYLRAEREADVLGKSAGHELALLKAKELAVVNAVDCTIVHSTHEAEVLARENVRSEVVVFPWIMDVHGRGPGFADRAGMMFLGGYQHTPNVDAVEYFAEAILPLVARELPGVPFYAVGSKPPDKLRQLPGVTVSGFVEDLRDYVDRCRIAVVPLRYGAGIKGKLATSMSYGLPSVTTSMGAEGMELVDEREVLIADTPEAFAAAVVRLYRDEATWTAISDAGLAYVDRMYSRAAGRRIIATVLGDRLAV